jgi:hypothetical protein
MRLIFFIILSIVLTSCLKLDLNDGNEFESCNGHCTTIRLSGKLIDLSYGKGIPNQKVSVRWNQRGLSNFFSSDKLIAEDRTDQDGAFDFTVTVDSSRFQKELMKVFVAIPEGFVEGGKLQDWFTSRQDVSPTISFEFYRKVNLAVNLKRTMTDNFAKFTVFSSYSTPYYGTRFNLGAFSARPDTTLNIITALNRYAKVEWEKYFAPGQFTYFTDSVFCNSANNSIILNY